MANYAVGQVVKVRGDLEVGATYGNCYFTAGMASLIGKEVTIKDIEDDGIFGVAYEIKEDAGACYWADEMLEPVQPKVESRILPIESMANFEIYVEKVIVNDPATIMFYRVPIVDLSKGEFIRWSDTKKVVAKCNKETDTYDISKGVNACILKAFRKEIDKQLRKL